MRGLSCFGLICLAPWLAAVPVAAATLTTIADFSAAPASSYPNGPLAQGPDGTLYGILLSGGDGAAFALRPPVSPSTTWKTEIIHQFTGAEGAVQSGGLTLGSDGALYGAALRGGAYGYGTIYQLKHQPDGGWVETTLVSFDGNNGGANPSSAPILLSDGNLYGTTQGGRGTGVIYRLSPPAPGQSSWSETVLYSASSGQAGPQNFYAGLTRGPKGTLYGASLGLADCGTFFRLTPSADRATWAEKDLFTFSCSTPGGAPNESLVAAPPINGGGFYGFGGNGNGTVFQLLPPSATRRAWSRVTLFTFPAGKNGNGPQGGLAITAAGTLYGAAATTSGYNPNDGLLWSLKRPATGTAPWTETVVHRFTGPDGLFPETLRQARGGVMVGTTCCGGPNQGGTVFELKP